MKILNTQPSHEKHKGGTMARMKEGTAKKEEKLAELLTPPMVIP